MTFIKWCSGSLLGNVVVSLLVMGSALFAIACFFSYLEHERMHMGRVVYLGLLSLLAAGAFGVAMWYGLVQPHILLRAYRTKGKGGSANRWGK